MAVSLEVRVPLLDHRLVERFAPAPAAHKMRGMRGKRALRRVMHGRLPEEVLAGKKRGFDTPVSAWLRGPLRGDLESGLRSLPSGWFRPEALAALNVEHQSGARDHGRLLWSLLVLERWRRRHEVVGLAG